MKRSIHQSLTKKLLITRQLLIILKVSTVIVPAAAVLNQVIARILLIITLSKEILKRNQLASTVRRMYQRLLAVSNLISRTISLAFYQ